MAVKQRTPKQRSLFRRILIPVSLATTLLAGGGWGVYHFLTSTSDSANQSKNLAEFDKSNTDQNKAHSASDQLKNIFASSEKKETATVAKEATPDAKTDRYSLTATTTNPSYSVAPELPPAVKQAVKESATEPKTSALATSPVGLGDRYTSAQLPPIDNQPNELPTEPAVQQASEVDKSITSSSDDVTRGQEPVGNPLRASGQTTATTDNFDAQQAFSDAPKPTPVAAAPVTPTSNPSNPFSNQLQQSNPLPPQSIASGSRYQSATPTPAEPPAVASRQPAPAYNFDSSPAESIPPASQQQTLVNAAPLAAAPTADTSDAEFNTITPTPGIATQPGTGRPGEKLLEGLQSASLSIQKLAPEEIQVGKRCTFAIRVRNTGQRTAQNVQVRDEIPLGTELAGTAPHATVSGSQLVWDLGSLSVGEERLVEMELIPKEEREIGSVATVTIAAQASAKSRCTRPQLSLRLSSKPQVHVGQQHLVQVELTNPGSGDATGVMLLETIPHGVSHEAGPALEFEVGTLKAGETRKMELILTAEQAGRITNVMTARADANLRVKATCEFEVLAPDLKVSVEGPQRRYLERPATYRVSINNPGTATAKDILLTTKLPKGLRFVGADNLGEYDSATHSVKWSLAELPANERGVVELTALPVEAGEQTLEISTSAHEGLEDSTEKRVLVEGITALTFEVEDLEGLVEVGGETTYEVVVENQGSKVATNVEIVAVFPPGLRAISGEGDSQHTIKGDRIIFAPLPQLAPKGAATYRIQAQGIRPGDQRVRVMIQSDDITQPISKEVSTRVYADDQ